jgi:hypothetical protein
LHQGQGQQQLSQQVATHPAKSARSAGLIYRREANGNAYSIRCPNGCGQTLLRPETLLLNTIQQNPPESRAAD